MTRSDFGKYTGITIMANNDTNPANVAIQQDPGLVVRTISPQVVEVYSPAPVVVGGTGNALALPNIIPTEPVYLRVQEDSANVVVKTAVMNFTGNAVTIIGQGSTATVQIDALGPASFGNWVFNGNTLYNFNGGIVDNSDDSHGATAFVRLPANGSGADPYQLLNYYGNITLTPGLNPGNTYNWTFDRTGNLTLPSNTAVIKYANGTPYGGSGNGTPGGSNTQIQYNNAGAFAGNAGLTFNQATGRLTATNISGNIAAPGSDGQLLLNVGNAIGITTGLSYNANANMLFANGVTAVGHPDTGVQGFYAGVAGYSVLGSAVLAQFTSNIGSYSQINQQNTNSGALASADYIITANNGTDTTYYLDIGLASSNHADPAFFGDTATKNDGYFYVTATAQAGPSSNAGPGNLIIGSTNGVIKMFVGNTAQANVVATVSSTGVSVSGNVTAGNLDATNLVINSITSDDSSFVTIEDGLNVAGDVNLSGDLVFSPTQVQSSAYAGGNGHAMMIDTNRTDTYVANGSADKPFKTFAAAIAAVAAENPTGTVPYTFILMGCNINETVDFTPYNFNFITISTTCRSTFNNPVIFGNSALLQLTIRNVEFGNTVTILGDGTANQFNNTSIYNVSFVGALAVTAVNAIAFYEAAFFSTVTFNNVSYCYVNGGQFNDDWTIRVDDTGAYPIPSGGIAPGVVLALDFIANDINFVKGGTGVGVFQPHSSRMGRTGQTYTLPASWILTAYSSAFLGNWVNDGTWTMRNSVNVVTIANTAPTYSGTIGGTTITATGNITGGNLTVGSGTITGGNVNGSNFNGNVAFGAGTVGGSGNITGGNLLFGSGVVSGTGNITGGNILTGGQVSATANITGGNLNTAGLTSTASLSITGNTATVTSANYSIGYLNIPQISLAANTTTALTDSGKHYYSTSASNLALTIANNTSVSWPVGTAISIVNRGTANITIAGGTGVSLYLSGNSTAGNRTVTTYGMATVMNVAANIWMINGTVV